MDDCGILHGDLTLTSATMSCRGILAAPGLACAATATALLVTTLLLAACGDSPVDPGPQAVEIVIAPNSLVLDTIGVYDTLTAVVINDEGDTIQGAEVEWTSANTEIATVDAAGVVTAIGFGSTQVTASHDTLEAQAAITVPRPLTDREILEVLYNETGGSAWTDNTNWLSGEELHEWYGVYTDSDGNVTSLRLRRNNLTGALPAEIGGLSHVYLLDLSYNSLTDSIPAELGKLTLLERLELNNNNLVGGLPSELGNLGVGEYLDFAHNSRLAGPIPLTFADLDLETFYSTDTDICVPPSLKDWFDQIPQTDNPTACTGDG